jgi:hypothetical protein
MQIVGIATACMALLSFGADMATMFKWTGAGLLEFYLGYALIISVGQKS